MTFNWSEYLEVARALTGAFSNPHSDEAKYRAAISRSYYAAFCTARDYLVTVDPSLEEALRPTSRFKPSGVHQRVLDEFETKDRKIRKNLRKLFDRRLVADYENPPVSLPTSTPDFKDMAESSCSTSWTIIDGISALLK